MGLLGVVIGLAEETYGIITDDEEHVKKGARRTLIGAGTMLVGDVFGVSDSVSLAADIAEASDA